MNQNSRTKSENSAEYFVSVAKAQLPEKSPDAIAQSMGIQLKRQHEAKDRIDEEGVVVRDLKGSVIPHPAIKIEQDATKVIADLFKKFGVRR